MTVDIYKYEAAFNLTTHPVSRGYVSDLPVASAGVDDAVIS